MILKFKSLNLFNYLIIITLSLTVLNKIFYLISIGLCIIITPFYSNSQIKTPIKLLLIIGVYFLMRFIFIDINLISEVQIFRSYFAWIFFFIFYYLFFASNSRVFGLLGRPSATATIIVCIFLLNIYFYTNGTLSNIYFATMTLFTLINLFLLSSGTGVFIFIVGLFITFYSIFGKLLSFFSISILTFLLYNLFNMQITIDDIRNELYYFGGLERLNLDYFIILLEMKINLIQDAMPFVNNTFFGTSPAFAEFGSDFGFGLMFFYLGYIGLLFFIISIFNLTNKLSFLPAFLMLLSNFHYPTTTTAIGSLMLGLILASGLTIHNSNFKNFK
jgi:hypothetical protein